MLPYTVPSQSRDSNSDRQPSCRTMKPAPSTSYSYVTGEVEQPQDEWPSGRDSRSIAHKSDDRLLYEQSRTCFGRQYTLPCLGYGLDASISSEGERFSPGSSGEVNETLFGHEYSQCALPLHQSGKSDLDCVVGLTKESCENGVFIANGQETLQVPVLADESSDGGIPSQADDQEAPFDRALFESLWTGPTPCFLGGCRPGRFFRTSQSWHSHVKNVHKKTLLCAVPGCAHTRLFANNTDLKRHVETKHEIKKPFKCQRPHCPRKVREWPRKDKLRLHNRKYHSNFRCFYCSENPRHQRWFDSESELWEHTISSHPKG